MKTFTKKFLIGAAILAASVLAASAQTYVRSGDSQSVVSLTLTNATVGTNAAQSLTGFQLGYGGNGTVDLASKVVSQTTNTAGVIFTLALADDPDGLGYESTTVTATNLATGVSTNIASQVITTGQHRWIKITDVQVVAVGLDGTNAPVSAIVSAKFGQHRP